MRHSDAAEKRLSAGDVIVEVAQEAVANAADVKKRVDQLKKDGKKSVLLLVVERRRRAALRGAERAVKLAAHRTSSMPYPAKAGYPVRSDPSVNLWTSLEYWVTRLRG